MNVRLEFIFSDAAREIKLVEHVNNVTYISDYETLENAMYERAKLYFEFVVRANEEYLLEDDPTLSSADLVALVNHIDEFSARFFISSVCREYDACDASFIVYNNDTNEIVREIQSVECEYRATH